MSFNVKHYVAIGLGFAVFAGFAMQKSTAPKQPVAFETHSGVFKPLSSFESSIDESPGFVESEAIPEIAYGEAAPRIAAFEPSPVPQTNQASTLQLDSEGEPAGQQVVFDSGQTSESQNAIEVPDFVDDAELELAEMIAETDELELAPAESGKNELDIISAFVAVDTREQETQAEPKNSDLANSRWNTNPFAEKATAQPSDEPAIDTSTADASAAQSPTNPSIIVEPGLNNPAQSLAEQNRSALVESVIELQPEMNLANATNSGQPSGNSAVRQAANEVEDTLIRSVAPTQLLLPDAVAQQAVHHIEYGKTLSRRGAAFAARQEFYSALRVIAQSNDTITNSNDHSRALSQAVLAMKEAKDFVSQNAESEMLTDVSSITEAHRSKIVDQNQAKSTSPADALQSYFIFAQQKLDLASGRNVVAAEALYCLGKLHTTISSTDSVPGRIDVARAMAYHQAALSCDKQNFRSANELGVLMARMGQLETAVGLFKQSLIANQTPQGWNNLATTHRRLGQQDLAQMANAEFQMLVQNQSTGSPNTIRWVENNSFNEQIPVSVNNTNRVAERATVPATDDNTTTTEKLKAKSMSIGERLKQLF